MEHILRLGQGCSSAQARQTERPIWSRLLQKVTASVLGLDYQDFQEARGFICGMALIQHPRKAANQLLLFDCFCAGVLLTVVWEALTIPSGHSPDSSFRMPLASPVKWMFDKPPCSALVLLWRTLGCSAGSQGKGSLVYPWMLSTCKPHFRDHTSPSVLQLFPYKGHPPDCNVSHGRQ